MDVFTRPPGNIFKFCFIQLKEWAVSHPYLFMEGGISVEYPPQGYFLEKRGAGNLHTAFDVAGAGNTIRDAGVRMPGPTIHFGVGKCFFV